MSDIIFGLIIGTVGTIFFVLIVTLIALVTTNVIASIEE